ncbi:uncharacterized membrane protein YcaP (DUF421 family) [Janibacter alkaliphilus]|uniref:Uncharacterized membrane protein YcaP (DUF421 family) n=2 Tax=Janibacter alkaliphilus TaxID=1069963 RepID=A0A852X462_9MICO|nr:uncharacterized membrane protein YcaP (DUF421 family) [Janibacter alkaliphilus]
MPAMDSSMIWNGWTPIVHGAVMATVGYVVLLILLRTSGPRTMSQMTPLDFVVAVTLGSAFGRTITAQKVAVVQLIWVLVVLVALKWAFAYLRSRSERMRHLLDHPPVVLYEDGTMGDRALRRHRLVEADVHEAARGAGKGSLADVHTVLLLRNGGLGVIGYDAIGDGSSVTPYVAKER